MDVNAITVPWAPWHRLDVNKTPRTAFSNSTSSSIQKNHHVIRFTIGTDNKTFRHAILLVLNTPVARHLEIVNIVQGSH